MATTAMAFQHQMPISWVFGGTIVDLTLSFERRGQEVAMYAFIGGGNRSNSQTSSSSFCVGMVLFYCASGMRADSELRLGASRTITSNWFI